MLIFGIVPWNDNLNDYAIKVIKILRGTFSKTNVAIIDKENENPGQTAIEASCTKERANNLLIESILFPLPAEINDWPKRAVTKNSSSKSKQNGHKNLFLSDNSIFPILTKLLSEHLKNVLLGKLNINFVRNKFESANEQIRNSFDTFIITDSKLDLTFSDSRFYIPGYTLFRKDCTKNWGYLMCYINQNLPVKIVTSYKFPSNWR